VNEDKATRYRQAQRTTVWSGFALFALAMVVLLPGGGAVVLRDFLVRTTGLPATSAVTAVLFALLLAALGEIVAIPITRYGAAIERRYGFAPKTAIGERFKSIGVTATLIGVATFVIYFNLSHWPEWWWLITGAMGIGVRELLGRHSHPSAVRLFACERLGRSELRTRLEALARRAGVERFDVYDWTPERGQGAANAILVGTGGACSVLLSNELVRSFTPDELEVVVAHELGHFVYRDIRNAGWLRAIFTLVIGGTAAAALKVAWQPLGLLAPTDAAGLPVLLLAAGAVALVTRPLLNVVSRRKEFRADGFALNLTGRPDLFVSVMRRLAERNLAETRPSLATVWLFHSHPTVEQRIQAARAFPL
jgi:STE24 endopeptidase